MLQKTSLFFTLYLIFPFLIFSQDKTKEKPAQPNILWIVCEDMSPHLSSFGEKVIKTPNLDQLAREGIKYTNVYMVAGVCAPSRSGIITAMYPTAIGTDNMRTGGKEPSMLNPDVPKPYSAVIPAEARCFPELLRQAGYYCTNNSKQDYQFDAPVTVWDESSKQAHWRKRPVGKPFFSVFNIEITHESQIWERDKQPLLVDPKSVDVPPYYPDVPEVRHDIARYLSNVILMDQAVGEIIKQLKEDGLYDKTIIFFYSDHGDGLPYVKREVLKRGLHVPLIIRFPGTKNASSINDQLISGIDLGPTVLSLAGVHIPGFMHGQAFLGNQRGKERSYVFAGRDRMDEVYDRVRSVMDKNFQYIRNYYTDKPYYQPITYRMKIPMMKKMIMMRDSGLLNKVQMRWFGPGKPAEELYDLNTDPYQLNNLAENPEYENKFSELKKVYDQWISTYGDRSSVPEKEMVYKEMWNGRNEAPDTKLPEIIKLKDGIRIKCATPGASLGYIINPKGKLTKSGWEVYNNEIVRLNKHDRITIRAQRIGYKAVELDYTY